MSRFKTKFQDEKNKTEMLKTYARAVAVVAAERSAAFVEDQVSCFEMTSVPKD